METSTPLPSAPVSSMVPPVLTPVNLALPPFPSFKSVFFSAWQLMKARYAQLFLIGVLGSMLAFVVYYIFLLVLSLVFSLVFDFAPNVLLGNSSVFFWENFSIFVVFTIYLFVFSFVGLAGLRCLLAPEKQTLIQLIRFSAQRVFSAVWILFLIAFLVCGFGTYFFIPSLYMGIILSFALCVFVHEDVKGFGALLRSVDLFSGYFFRLFVYEYLLLFVFVAPLVVMFIAYFLFQFPYYVTFDSSIFQLVQPAHAALDPNVYGYDQNTAYLAYNDLPGFLGTFVHILVNSSFLYLFVFMLVGAPFLLCFKVQLYKELTRIKGIQPPTVFERRKTYLVIAWFGYVMTLGFLAYVFAINHDLFVRFL